MGKRQMLAALACLKTMLILFNTVFWLSGLFVLLLGVWMELRLHMYMELQSAELESLLPSFFIGLGAAIVVLASLACRCTAKGQAPLLYIYSSLLTVIFLLEVTVLSWGYNYRERLSGNFHRGLSNGLQLYGRDSSQTSAVDAMQATLHCCGLSNYTDWQGTPWGRGHTNKLPHSCCQSTEEGVCTDRRDTAELYRTGCYRLVVNFVLENLLSLGIGIAVVATVHLVGVILAFCLAKNVNKAQYEEIR